MLSIENLTYRIAGRVLLEGASLSLPAGHHAGLVGRNGSGKSTLLKLIAGDLHADAGDVSLPNGTRIGMVAQDTLLKVFENWEQLRDPEQVKPWVFRIARNCCLMKRRSSVFAPKSEVPLEDVDVASNWEAADEAVMRKEMNEELERALRAIPEIYRAVVMLRDVEELSTGETAALLEISEDNVKQRLHRGRAMLRKLLVGA